MVSPTTTDTINTGEEFTLSYRGSDNTALDSVYIEFSPDGAVWDSVYFDDFTDILRFLIIYNREPYTKSVISAYSVHWTASQL